VGTMWEEVAAASEQTQGASERAASTGTAQRALWITRTHPNLRQRVRVVRAGDELSGAAVIPESPVRRATHGQDGRAILQRDADAPRDLLRPRPRVSLSSSAVVVTRSRCGDALVAAVPPTCLTCSSETLVTVFPASRSNRSFPMMPLVAGVAPDASVA